MTKTATYLLHNKVAFALAVALGAASILGGLAARQGLEQSLMLLALLLGTGFVTYLAFRHPLVTIALTFALGIVGSDIQPLLPPALQEPSLGGLTLRYFDPILLGVALALFLKLLGGSAHLFRALTRDHPALSLLLLWLLGVAFASAGRYGLVASLGEFRTYHQHLLLVPYIVVFVQSRETQWRLFVLLLACSFLFLPLGLVLALLTPGVSLTELSGNARFLGAATNLAVIWGVVGLYVADKYGLLRLNRLLFGALLVGAALVTLANAHRSVWLATGISFALLLLLRRFAPRRLLEFALAALLLGLAVLFVPTETRSTFVESVERRATAFTDFQDDSTARWRYELWLLSLDVIRENPLSGAGLGRHFQFYDSQGILLMTSPHNHYVTMAFQAGLVGLGLYLLFIARQLLRLWGALRAGGNPQDKAMLYTAFIVLVASAVFYVAYTADFATWLFIGLGLSVMSRRAEA